MESMRNLARMLAVGALAVGLIAVGGTTGAHASCPEPGQGPPGCQTGPVPESWGEPTWEHATFGVVGRQNGYLPTRRGNQHVTEVDTRDEEGIIAGVIRDWFCPAGAVAPLDPGTASQCRLKATYWIDYDYSYTWPGETAYKWAPNLRYVNHRLPIVITDNAGARVDQGWVSLHLKATGAVTQSWYNDDYVDILDRAGAYVSGGHILGKAWLAMDSVSVDVYFLYREYYPEG